MGIDLVEGRDLVCQDFAHGMLALLRLLRIPARYVSRYLYRGIEDHDRSTPDATHAWVEALMPHFGWVGFDPTNNLVVHHRHIRTAVGRDNSDVPPTHGVFRGSTASELYVAVQVTGSDPAPALDRKLPIPEDWSVLVERAQQPAEPIVPHVDMRRMQQQQQAAGSTEFAGACVLIELMRLRRAGRTWNGLAPSLGLLLLSGLWALSSLRSDLFPHSSGDTSSPALSQAALFAAFAALAAAAAIVRRLSFPRGRLAWACGGVGLGLFVLPALLASFAQGAVSTLDRVAVFSLTPVFAVVLQPYLQDGPPERGKASLAASICAVAGILLLFPLDVPGSFRAAAALVALVAAALGIAAANCVAVRLARAIAKGSILPMAAQAGAASAIGFAAAGALTPHSVWQWSSFSPAMMEALAIDLPALFLLFWLMRHLAASRMTARFLLAPFLTALAGATLQPASPSQRAWLGMALLAGGGAWLVFAPAEPSEGSELHPLPALFADSSRRPPPG